MSPLGGYCATKFAMVGLTEALRMELFATGIRVSLVMPGVIDTPMTTDFRVDNLDLSQVPSFFKMPVQWVTWAVLAATALGLTEVDVPPGAAVLEKLAALFPGVTDAFLSVGSAMMRATARFAGLTKAPESEPAKVEAKKAQIKESRAQTPERQSAAGS